MYTCVYIAQCSDCSAPGNGSSDIPHGKSVGDTCFYECKERYDLIGNSNSTCEPFDAYTSKWEPSLPPPQPYCRRKYYNYVLYVQCIYILVHTLYIHIRRYNIMLITILEPTIIIY